MLTTSDINNIESDEQVSEIEYFKSIQRAINSGSWGLQGSYGRTMMAAIEDGRCMLGHVRAKDYYGNVVPARYDVKFGTKGSYEFVVAVMDTEWADEMAAV
jgi:hypothetical protein